MIVVVVCIVVCVVVVVVVVIVEVDVVVVVSVVVDIDDGYDVCMVDVVLIDDHVDVDVNVWDSCVCYWLCC